MTARFTWAKSESLKDYYNVDLFWVKFMPISIYEVVLKNYSNNNFYYNFPEVEDSLHTGKKEA